MSPNVRSPRIERAATVDIFELALKMGQDALPRQQHCLCRMRDHPENTPSMLVYPRTNSFFCWGCKAGGDTIAYVMGCDGSDFIDALRKIEELFGLKHESFSDSKASEQITAMVKEMHSKYGEVTSFDLPAYAALIEGRLIQWLDDVETTAKRVGGLDIFRELQGRVWYSMDKAVTGNMSKEDLDTLLLVYSKQADDLNIRLLENAEHEL